MAQGGHQAGQIGELLKPGQNLGKVHGEGSRVGVHQSGDQPAGGPYRAIAGGGGTAGDLLASHPANRG